MDLYGHARASVQSFEAAQRKVDGLDGILRSLEAYEHRTARPSVATWLSRLALDSRSEEDPAADDGITLMTLHAAKGLEFPVVFLVGVEEDLLPLRGHPGRGARSRRGAAARVRRHHPRAGAALPDPRRDAERGKLLARTPSRFLEDLLRVSSRWTPTRCRPPEQVAAQTESVMAALRARLGATKSLPSTPAPPPAPRDPPLDPLRHPSESTSGVSRRIARRKNAVSVTITPGSRDPR